MSVNYNSGKSTFVGWGLPTDPGTLDPTKYEGAVIYNGLDQILYYSNGDEWTQPLNAPIRKPYALEPTNSAQQSQLRLSQFLTGTGFEDKYRQIAVMFEVYTSPDMTEESQVPLPINPTDVGDSWVFPLTFGLPPEYVEPNNDYIEESDNPAFEGLLVHTRSIYQLPKELFEPEAKFYWRAKYIANDGQESLFSDLYEQTYPSIIDQPYSMRKAGLITDKIEISQFVSAFSRQYLETKWEAYENPPTSQIIDGKIVETPVGGAVWSTTTTVNPNDIRFNPFRINILSIAENILIPGRTYYWRAQHFDNDGAESDWSYFSSVTRPETNVIKLVYDTRIGTGSNVEMYLRGTNIVVDWGDGSTTTGTSGQTTFSHDYNIANPGEYTVTISGNVTRFTYGDDPTETAISEIARQKLTKIKSFGKVTFFRVSNSTNLIEVPDYLPSTITSMRGMFSGCTKFNQDLNLWDTSNIVDMQGMFAGATLFNGNISTWVTTKVGDIAPRGWGESFNSMFDGAISFNQNLNYREVYDFTNPDVIKYWDTSNSPSMTAMFRNARSFNGDIRNWKLNTCNSTASMFEGATAFNNDLSLWDLSQVLDVSRMFYGATNFNRNIGTGDLSFALDFTNMFTNAVNFNRDISHWKISTRSSDEIKMAGMFYGARNFNSVVNYNIENGTWDVSRVVDMSNMFRDCLFYNQPLADWNVSNVKSTHAMFYNARSFDQPLTSWNMAKVENASYMFYQALKFNRPLTWDLSKATNLSWMFAYTDSFDSDVRFKLCTNLTQTVTLGAMFYYARIFNKNIRYNIDNDGAWNTSRVTSLDSMFYNARAFNQDISNWDVTNVTNMYRLFYDAVAFDQNLGSWNVAKVTNMAYTFYGATRFNNGGSDSIKNWITSEVTTMNGMFWYARAFDQPIGSWNVSKVTDFGNMFRQNNFNRPLNDWDTSKATSFYAMFYYSPKFNQPIGNWNTKLVNNMTHMFSGALEFNQPLTTNGDKWNTSNVTQMYAMFYDTNKFNQDLSSWNTGNVNNMAYMFWYARAFTNTGQSLNNWNTSNVIWMHYMFGGSKFNSSISSWNTAKVEYMHYMFYDCPFNQPINSNGDFSWNTSKVRTMYLMFAYNSAFNQPISGWKTLSVTDMGYMFFNSPFNQPIGSWNTAKVVYMNGMFYNTNFDQDISNWNVSKVAYMNDMFRGSRNNITTKLSTVNYDKLLDINTGWPSRAVIPGVVFHAGASKYSSTNANVINGRSKLVNKPNLWTITDGGTV